jgi:uncharacterized protein (DUF885 family)
MPSIDDIAAEYVERAAALDPFYATYAGIAGHDHELADLGADGFAERAGLDRSTLAALDAAEAPEPREQVARAAMRERLALAVECYDAGDTTSELNTITSWVQMVREVFDLMPTDGEEAAANIARRMAAVPRAYRQLSATLLDAARNGRSAARLQVGEVVGQCAAWARPGDSFYSGLVGRLTGVPDSLRGELGVAARAATAATAELGAFLDRELMPLAREKDERQLRSELRRCLGLPGQAPSYKLGERIWLQAREDAMARAGGAFSLKDFHAKALSLGAMGLDPLREALARV